MRRILIVAFAATTALACASEPTADERAQRAAQAGQARAAREAAEETRKIARLVEEHRHECSEREERAKQWGLQDEPDVSSDPRHEAYVSSRLFVDDRLVPTCTEEDIRTDVRAGAFARREAALRGRHDPCNDLIMMRHPCRLIPGPTRLAKQAEEEEQQRQEGERILRAALWRATDNCDSWAKRVSGTRPPCNDSTSRCRSYKQAQEMELSLWCSEEPGPGEPPNISDRIKRLSADELFTVGDRSVGREVIDVRIVD